MAAPSRSADLDERQFVQQSGTQHGSSEDNQGAILGNAVNSTVIGQEFINNIHGNVYITTPLAPHLSTRSRKGGLQPQLKSEAENPYHPDSDQLVSTAREWENQGEDALALSLYNVIFSSRRKDSGPWHLATLETAYDIARILEKQGKNQMALKWYDEIFEVRQKTLGGKDATTLKTAYSVARILVGQGRHEAALRWYNEVFKVRQKTLGNRHSETLETAYNVAEILELQGRNDAALKWYKEILEAREEALGTDKLETSKAMESVARVTQKIEGYNTAV